MRASVKQEPRPPQAFGEYVWGARHLYARRPMTDSRLALLALASWTLASANARAAGDDAERTTLRAELGAEYDSNAHRTEAVSGGPPVNPVESWVERVVVGGAVSDVVADGQAISVSATGAAKLFDATAARNETVAVAQSSLAWRVDVSRRARLITAGAYYEAFQNAGFDQAALDERRDFRSLAGTLQLGIAASPQDDFVLGAGYRSLVFKADQDFNFQGPTASLDWRWTRTPEGEDDGGDWELGAGIGSEQRRFAGPALAASCPGGSVPGLPCPGVDQRLDRLYMAHADATRTGRLLTGLGYALVYNASNSYGETVTRHFAILRLAAALPLDLTLAARAELLFAFYREAVPLIVQSGCTAPGSGCTSIEEENRSSVRVDLSRPLGDHVRLFARYTFYANELGSSAGHYRRQTLLLSLAVGFDGPSN
jgi:hypothetical protein